MTGTPIPPTILLDKHYLTTLKIGITEEVNPSINVN